MTMGGWQVLKLAVATRLVLWARPVLLVLGDRTWIRLLRAVGALLPGARGAIGEVVGVLEAGPPGTTLLRRMVAETTPDEVRDLLWGVLCFEDA